MILFVSSQNKKGVKINNELTHFMIAAIAGVRYTFSSSEMVFCSTYLLHIFFVGLQPFAKGDSISLDAMFFVLLFDG